MSVDTNTEVAVSRLLGEHSVARGAYVVTAASANAAAAGVAMLHAGGNAFDAALASCFVETVALPMKCGLAGDLVALVRERNGRVTTLVSIGPGCAALADGAQLSVVGPASVGVPGAPDGYMALARRARLPLATLVRPAVDAARRGVVWTRPMLAYLKQSASLLERFSADCPYLRNAMPAEGDRIALPGLGDLLEAFVERGAALFDGPLGDAIVERVGSLGGFISREDFRARPARDVAPASAVLAGGLRVTTTPAPTQGPALIRALQRHLEDGEPLFDAVANARRAHLARDEGTSVVTAADQDTVVVVVHSNSFPRFGSAVVMPSGLVLNNRPGRSFRLDAPPGTPGAPAAGAVPSTTLHAWTLECSDGTFAAGATPGGINQLPWNAQTLSDLVRKGLNTPLESLLVAPRWAVDDSGAQLCEANLDMAARIDGACVVPPMSLGTARQIVVCDSHDGTGRGGDASDSGRMPLHYR
ncbi:MAG TPA: gamma-glutamyltransferase, partial [Paraburkholderia sp.]